jgi:hypothetical protein
MKITVFFDVTLCNLLQVYQCFGRIYRLRLQGRKQAEHKECGKMWYVKLYLQLVLMAHSSYLKMEAVGSSITSVNFCHATRLRIPEDTTLHGHRHESIASQQRKLFCTRQLRLLQVIVPDSRESAIPSLS